MTFLHAYHAGLVSRVAVSMISASMVFVATTAYAADAKQKSFAAPEDAVKELIAAAKAADAKAMLAVLGPEARPIIQSGDAVADKAGRERFVKSYEEANKLEKSGDARAVLSIGKDNWPFPIPVVKDAAGWRFDTKAGKEEILNRRIGRNELAVIQVVQAYLDAQREYYLRNPQQDKLPHFAQKLASSQGKRDGLYWPVKAGEKPSPLGPLVTGARAEGYAKGEGGKPAAYHGLSHTQGARAGSKRRRLRLRGTGKNDWWFRTDCMAGDVRQFGNHDLHCQPRWRGVREGPRTGHGRGHPEDDKVQPGQDLEAPMKLAAAAHFITEFTMIGRKP
jgi:hypothetical protein